MIKAIAPGESAPGRVGAVFDSREGMEGAIRALERSAIASSDVTVVRPHEETAGRKLEPESTGIARTLVSTHVRFGLVGCAAGVAIGGAALALGVEIARASPPFLLFVAAFLGAMFGLLFAGLVSLRPDHDRLVLRVQEAAREGRWSVVVHTGNKTSMARAKEVLEAQRGNSISSL